MDKNEKHKKIKIAYVLSETNSWPKGEFEEVMDALQSLQQIIRNSLSNMSWRL